jgi:O-antigen/teichoic acid export membrane protein
LKKKNMRSIRIYKNVISSITLQTSLAIVGLVIPKMILDIYGSEINGLVNAITQFITYVALIEFGIGDASVALLYKPLAYNDYHGISDILSGTRKMYIKSAVIYSMLLLILAALYPLLYSETLGYWFIFKLVFFIGAINSIDYFILGKYRVLLMADQKYYIVNFTRTIATCILLVSSVLLLSAGYNVVTIKALAAFIHIGEALVLLFYVKHKYPSVNYHAKNTMRITQRWNALVHQICGTVVYSTDLVVLTLCLPNHDLLEISVYAVYGMVFSLIQSFTSTMMRTFYAPFGDMITRKETDTVKESYLKFEYIYYIFIGFICACFMSLVMPFVACYTHGKTDVEYIRFEVALLFALNGFSAQAKDSACVIANAAGKFKETQRFSIEEAIINIVISLLLVKPLGIVGVLIGTLISHIWMDIRYVRYVETELITGIGHITIKRIIRTCIIIILLTIPEVILIPINEKWFSWIVMAIVIAIINGCVFILLNAILEKEMMKGILLGVKEKIRVKKQGTAS